MTAVGIIPARGGSKGVPLKNIKPLNGKPLIEYSIESALKANALDRVLVSTDHSGIADVCQKYQNVDVINRPSELATDKAPTEWALVHACEVLKEKENFEPDYILILEPTSPFRSSNSIVQCIRILETTDADSVVGVTESYAPYGRIVDGRFEHLFPNQPRRRQDREPLYKECSTIWGTKREVLIHRKSVLGDCLYPLIVDEKEAIDINNEFDFAVAEAVMKTMQKD